jgi:hypothetical protein
VMTGRQLNLQYLQANLTRIHLRLQRQMQRWQAAGQNVSDPFRGLYISQAEASALAWRPLGAGWEWFATLTPEEERAWEEAIASAEQQAQALAAAAEAAGVVLRLQNLADVFDLDAFEMDVLLLALAPEVDLRYERLYAYLQDDVSKKRPSVNLAFNLFCTSLEEKLARQAYFTAEASLLRHDLVELIADPAYIQPPLLAHYLKLDDQIVAFLLGHYGLDRRLAAFCRTLQAAVYLADLQLDDEAGGPWRAMVRQAAEAQHPLILCLHGPCRAERLALTAALAAEIGAAALVADLPQALEDPLGFDRALKLLCREAWLQDALLCLEGMEALPGGERGRPFERLQDALATAGGLTILSSDAPWTPTGRHPLSVINVPLAMPGFSRRLSLWRDSLAAAGVVLPDSELDLLTGRFRLTAVQIAEAVTIAHKMAGGDPALGDLLAAARAQAGHELGRLARKIAPVYTWDDMVLPADTEAQLREICQRVAQRYRVMDEWGFGRKLSLGKGVTVLFAGPSGTGKTMAAEVIANALGVDLYKIDLAGVVSKYIGETEKNLDRIFSAAENANAILFFDEADALFGKRSEVRDAHDRYANIEISYLLQKMEEYDGIAILATNLRQNLDEAFVRRLAFTVHFPFPDEQSRRRIWQGIWPAALPLANASAASGQAVDLDFLARQFKLSGGNIKNIALAAAFLAAEDGKVVATDHLQQATRREYQKMGKSLSEAELNCTRQELSSDVEYGGN